MLGRISSEARISAALNIVSHERPGRISPFRALADTGRARLGAGGGLGSESAAKRAVVVTMTGQVVACSVAREKF